VFGLKKKMNRDLAAAAFMDHCRASAALLRAAIVELLRSYCDGLEGRRTLGEVVSRPLVAYEGGKLRRTPKLLLDAHCYAIVLAAGLRALRREHIDPPDQVGVMISMVHRLIVEEDVGKEHVGVPAPSRLPGGVHVQPVPGQFVGGVPSVQQRLTRWYGSTEEQQLAMLLLSLRVLRSLRGIRKIVYEEFQITETLRGRNEIGTVQPSPDEVDEWEEDLIIHDPKLALSELPETIVRAGLTALEKVDPFWPTYRRRYRLTW
jgi:hypothetical protein